MHPIQQKLLKLQEIRDLSSLSYREIGRHLADDDSVYARVHPQTVKYHFEQLIKTGLLNEAQRPVIRAGGASSIGDIKLISIPIVGSANCGPATIFSQDRIEGYLRMSPTKLKSKNYNDLFALVASGNSMNRSEISGGPINNGDYVVIDRYKSTPKDGERVVVVSNDVANIKRIYFDHDDQMVVLRSESEIDYNPIYIDPQDQWDGLISGTVIQVIKNRGRVAHMV